MLTSIKFKFGSAPGQQPLELPTPPSVTIFVGPNNSGKSQALSEISARFHNGIASDNIIDSISFIGFDSNGARAQLDASTDVLRPGEIMPSGYAMLKAEWPAGRQQVHEASYLAALQAPRTHGDMQQFASHYSSRHILSLDGASRLALINPQHKGDLKYPEQPLARLLTDNSKRASLRRLIYDATGMHFAIDVSTGDYLTVRFGDCEPPNERSLEDDTLDYMRSARGSERVSDGVKAFTGILVQLHAGSHRVITIDEPEAFLHPGLAFTLGKELARGAVEEDKHIFASTHSAHFLMGAISSGAMVNIVRLTYSGGVATARLLNSHRLRELMQDPLL